MFHPMVHPCYEQLIINGQGKLMVILTILYKFKPERTKCHAGHPIWLLMSGNSFSGVVCIVFILIF